MCSENEAAAVPKCLGSVKNVVNEMVVLDTSSGDRIPQIPQKFGAKVHHIEWYKSFSAAWNKALKYVMGN